MERDWQSFKALYGNIEGAREGFEKACETLFRKVYYPKPVSQMAVKQGDGGIDVFVGKFEVEPITVIQCKFFLDTFGDSQKAQIRESFNRAQKSDKYQLKEWILAVPRVIDIDENSWWYNWVERQDIDIRLINGNELIDLMKEHDVYNQIFQMEDSIRLKEIHDVIIPKKKEISSLSNEKSFLDEVFRSIQREEPVMLLSMTSTPYHNKVAKYYKDKIYEMAIEHYSKNAVFSFNPSSNEEISQAKYFSKLAKQCGFEQDISDGDDFIEALDNKLMSQDICLLISEFENGSDKYRREFALALRPLLLDNDSEHSCSIVILGRKRLAKLKYEENGDGNSPLNYFEELLIPTPTIEDYKQIENVEEDISDIYQLTGGHPELMKFCLRNKSEDYQSLILNSNYGDKFFGKYQSRTPRLLKLFRDESFGSFSLWSSDELMRDLFWDNLIVEDGNRFKWIAPIVAELGKRYFR
jgi:hypothetical protein